MTDQNQSDSTGDSREDHHPGDSTILGPTIAPKLQVLRGDSPGKIHPLKFKTRVGRETDNDITIVDPKISRYHFQISFEDSKWLLSDLGSVNGTQINGLKVSVPQALSHGDRITVGETVMVFRDPTVEKGQPFDGATTVHDHTPATAAGPQTVVSNRRMAWIAGGLILILLLAIAGLTIWFNRNQGQAAIAPAGATPTRAVTILRTTPKPEQNLTLKYDEDFSDSFSGWDDAFGKDFTKQYGNNRYHIEITTNNLVVWGLANRVAADFEVEVEATQEDGLSTNTYGLIFRYVNHDNYYRFDLSGDGFFLLSKFENGVWSTLADWAKSDAIHQGSGTINVLKVSASGPNLTVFANGEELAQVTDEAFSEGNFGFFASTFEGPHIWVSFDALKLWAPPDQEIALIPTVTPVQAAPAPTAVVQAITATPEPTATPQTEPTATATLVPPTSEPTTVATPTVLTPAVITETIVETATLTPTVALTPTQVVTLTETPTPVPQQLPDFVSRDQPLGRGEVAQAGKIYFPVFDANRGTYDIFRANPNGTEQELIQTEASQVALNQAGTNIAYRSWKADERGLFTRPLDSTEKWRFVQFFEAASPAFSTDDQFFVFHSRQGGGPPALYRTFGTEHEVLRRESIPIQGEMVALTSDNRVVYRGCTGNTCGLIITNLDGFSPQQLTINADDTAASISPDEQTIAFMTNRDGNWEIYTMGLDGQNLQRLTNAPGNDGLPTWSPDGQQIAFVTNRDGQWAIWEMLPNGQQQRQLFVLPGSIDGIVQVDINHSFGWLEERIVWKE